jgi:mono/diheme cytochrome c family protein
MRSSIIGWALLCIAPTLAYAAGDVSVEHGAHMAIIGGCHDCHSVGYAEAGGKIDPATALEGSPVGFSGPWGTTYPANLRLIVAGKTEDQFLDYAKNLKTRPPMPWFGLNAMEENDIRSLYRYIASLGAPGDPAPDYVPPGEAPKTPFIVFAPPQMPK